MHADGEDADYSASFGKDDFLLLMLVGGSARLFPFFRRTNLFDAAADKCYVFRKGYPMTPPRPPPPLLSLSWNGCALQSEAGGVSSKLRQNTSLAPPLHKHATSRRETSIGAKASLSWQWGADTNRLDKIAPIRTESAFIGGSLAPRRPMDDEEEDTSRPTSQPRGAPFADLKYGERAARIPSPALALVPRVRDDDGGICALACDLQMQHRVPFHGNATWRWHFPARFEPLEDRGARRDAAAAEEERRRRRREGDDRTAERPGRRQRAAPSAEAQIGQKLREIGDKFQRDHLDVFLRQQRQNLPAWMRLTMALFGFLFPRPFAVPPRRAEQR